jgi:hypothetical protein
MTAVKTTDIKLLILSVEYMIKLLDGGWVSSKGRTHTPKYIKPGDTHTRPGWDNGVRSNCYSSTSDAVTPCEHLLCLEQGGPNILFPRAKNSFPDGCKGQETSSGTIF